jgi:hypothetical protein
VAASLLAANVCLAIPQARLIDRMGQSRVLPAASLLFAAGLVAMMESAELGHTAPWPHLWAAIANRICRRSGPR